ncbi:hypothetical protein [Azospirillum sp. SYSU D00513]|uniref:hypothetical protein n=1 Tax=Azospirillum sp. SYSU D00513 TaxID=2812561 RepID=UPI001A973C1C|nr:hypothetical protein [Azospirillum sp. SYSU D00513]
MVKVEAQARKEGRAAPSHIETIDVAAVIDRLRQLCQAQPRRYGGKLDIDRIVAASVNVPFPHVMDPAALARSITENSVPPEYAGHIGRFLGELPLTDILRFCDRHGIKAPTLARFVRDNRAKLALRRPELDQHIDALVPSP